MGVLDPATAAKHLARVLRDDRLIALVGSGASADMVQGGRTYHGLPTPSQFVQLVSKRHSYVAPDLEFTAACDAVIERENRHALEKILLGCYEKPLGFNIPPAHRMLAWLPFAAYLTSNYDQFLERQLEAENRKVSVVIDNEDLGRIAPGSISVIKYHGCVSRPRSMVAASGDLERLAPSTSLVSQLISVTLANSHLLVIGHGLADADLSRILDEVLAHLDHYAPRVVVVREPDRGDLPAAAPQVDFVHEDLTQFLSRILHEHRVSDMSDQPGFAAHFDEQWLSSAFFAQLRQASVLPSETQVIDAFLTHLVDELAARDEVASARSDARIAVERALDERPNYAALKKTWDEIDARLEPVGEDVAQAEQIVRDHIEVRDQKRSLFGAAGRLIVARDDRLLVFSQSQRVLQVLRGVPVAVQKTVDIFAAECRPKSPRPYDDAATVCRELSSTSYDIAICPDVVAIHLLASKQITRVVMGTHAIYLDEVGSPYAFVNTCGSLAIALAAERYGVPFTVVGEELKYETVARDEAFDHLHPHQENDLTSASAGLLELSTARGSVGHINIGYDLVMLTPNMDLVVPDAVASS